MLWYSLRYLGSLLALQVLFGAIAFRLADWLWLAGAVSLLFLGLVWLAGRSFFRGAAAPLPSLRLSRYPAARREPSSLGAATLTALLWQAPGLQGSLRFLSDNLGWTNYDGVTDLQDFLMQTWHTVLMPLLSAVPVGQVDGYHARYYILLTLASPFLVLLFLAAGIRARR